ncbi:MAG: AMIN domain-containing protein [Candidatus Sulfotelmatobacter sp.]
MNRSVRAAAGFVVCAAFYASTPIAGQGQDVPSVRRVQVIGNRNPVEIEIEASDRLVPKTQLLTAPDRLVVDFANAVPGARLHNQTLNRGEVKSVRVGLFTAKPPVTRIVFDLLGPQAYQVFPAGRTVIVKVGSAGVQTVAFNPSSSSGPASGIRLVNTSYPAQSAPAAAPEPPPLVVSFQAGQLTISSNKATLSEILFAVHQRTGADIAIPAGAEQEKVVAEIGPASAPEVLSHLLNGSKFNFLILSSASDPATLDRVILSARPEGPAPAYRPPPQARVDDDAEADSPSRVPPPRAEAPSPATPSPGTAHQGSPAAPDTKTPPSGDVPD